MMPPADDLVALRERYATILEASCITRLQALEVVAMAKRVIARTQATLAAANARMALALKRD